MTVPRPRTAMSNPLSQMLATFSGSADADATLLARFRSRRDETAFAELVRRHGPLVYGVCRRALGDGPDAEDALQACFLVLARRIDTACEVANLAGWLYRVACLTARKARIRRAKRRAAETPVAELPDVPAPVADRDPELGRVIDEELARLPDAYRTAVVLCELRELTLDEAAAELGCPRGTVASRLSRGRGLLGQRLLRRGLAGVGLAAGAASARVPAALTGRVVEGVLGEANGVAVQLSQEVLRAMSGTKLKAAVLAGFAVLAAALGGLSQRGAETHAAPVPELKAKGPMAELDRVRLDKIGAALACPTIREQLKITEEQDRKLEEAWEEVSGSFAATVARLAAGGPQKNVEDVAKLFDGLDDTTHAFDEKAVKVLTAGQQTRLRQIQLQRDGVGALVSRHAVRALRLTPEQEDKLTAEAAKTRVVGLALLYIELQAGGGGNPQAKALVDSIQKKQANDAESLVTAALKHLTAEQRKVWAELIGGPIPGVELVRATTPFSDPKFLKLLQRDAAIPAPAKPPVAQPPVPVEKK